jgi:hypothetical protein
MKKIGLAIQRSQGQDRQPLSPEGTHHPAVRDARVHRVDAHKRILLYAAHLYVSTLFLLLFLMYSIEPGYFINSPYANFGVESVPGRAD